MKMGAELEWASDIEYKPLRAFYERLKEASANLVNSDLLARMLASQLAGEGAMPQRLGLTSKQFSSMMGKHFPQLNAESYIAGPDLDLERHGEREDLRTLLIGCCEDVTDELEWFADILAGACMAANHLWQDLGLWSRADLSQLMAVNFPVLAARNDRDMKWKKFLYKQLCNAEGVYTCRSPSCEVCDDFNDCFGSEE